jgi:hypothetical protein
LAAVAASGFSLEQVALALVAFSEDALSTTPADKSASPTVEKRGKKRAYDEAATPPNNKNIAP